jgi:hypothetical protein
VPLKHGEKLSLFGGHVIRADEEIGDYGIQIDDEFVMGGTSVNLHTPEAISRLFLVVFAGED